MPQHPDHKNPNTEEPTRGRSRDELAQRQVTDPHNRGLGSTMGAERRLYRSYPSSDPETVTALLNRLERMTTERDTLLRIIMDAEKELNANTRTIADLRELSRMKDNAMDSDQQTIATLEKQVHDLLAKLNPAGKAKPKRKR